jgi:hypothetical protein
MKYLYTIKNKNVWSQKRNVYIQSISIYLPIRVMMENLVLNFFAEII